MFIKDKKKNTYRFLQDFLPDYNSRNILENHCLTCNVHKRKKRLKSKRYALEPSVNFPRYQSQNVNKRIYSDTCK